MKLNTSEIDWKLTFSSFGFVLLLGILAVVYPEAVKSTMGSMLDFTVINFGSGFLWYTLFATGALLYLAFSKYGDIRMGDSKPKFTKFQLFAMALSAGMGASTMYWGFIEAVYYFMDPQFGITDAAMAMEYATAYNMFHWGAAGWFIYLIVAIPFSVVFYLKKSHRMSLSGVINSLFNDRLPMWAQKLIDLLFIITTLAATALTLGLGIPMISSNLASLTGIPDNLMLGIGVILGLSVIFSLSSYIGIEKGMARLSSATIYICAAFVGIIFIIGPSALIMNNFTNGVGIMITEYIRMSTNTDPYGTTLFPQYWTVFFLANWISYSPGVGVFITKIIQGQKLRDVVLILVVGGVMGSAVIFGVCGTFSMDLINTGAVDGAKLIADGQPTELVRQVFDSTSISMVLTAIYLITMILFTVTTLDGTSYSLAGIATKQLDEEANVNPMFRLFWCLLLTALPIIFLLINADLNILKAFPVLIIVLIVPVFFVAAVKTLQYLKNNYTTIMAHQAEQDKLLGIETAESQTETTTQKPAIQA